MTAAMLAESQVNHGTTKPPASGTMHEYEHKGMQQLNDLTVMMSPRGYKW